VIGNRNITEFNYRFADPGTAHVFVGVQISGKQIRNASSRTESNGLDGLDLTDNELAKLHIRHMVGGHAPQRRTSACCASNSRNARAR
jgi:threonine dehydratase